MKTYAFDAVYRQQEDNIDMKFYIMGGAGGAYVCMLWMVRKYQLKITNTKVVMKIH